VTRLLALALVLATAPIARADDEPTGPRGPCTTMRKVYDSGDYEGARKLALACYELDPQPKLLFALAQIELNLHHYKEAIDYYEKFKATHPPPDQAALAEQGIGAARAELDRPPPPPPPATKTEPPPPPPHRELDSFDTALLVTGGVAITASAVLFYESHALSNDRSGSLAAYSHRLDHAYLARNTAYGTAAAGVLALGAAFVRWRYRLVVDVQPAETVVSIRGNL
jgi:hypothetical protein